ncbi:thioredoxin [Planctomycetales bacterium]|nr:thioredoxin [Planctomycetales bacterium]
MLSEITGDTFESVITTNAVVLVDFWSPTCVPCRQLAPILAEIAEEYEDDISVVKVNTAENAPLAAKYGIDMLPTLLFFSQGKVVNRMTGVQPKHKIEESLDEIA